MLVPETDNKDEISELDERLLLTPHIAIQRCNELVCEMAEISVISLKNSLNMLMKYDSHLAKEICDAEDKADHYEDILGTYLVKLSSNKISDSDSSQISKLLKVIGDFERISDHSVNILESAEELRNKDAEFTPSAKKELSVLCSAVSEILTLSYKAFINNDLKAARDVEPLEQVIDGLKDKLRNAHIKRLKDGICSIEVGFVWADLLTNLERTADHCSNIAVCVIDAAENNMNIHQSVKDMKNNNKYFNAKFVDFSDKYTITE